MTRECLEKYINSIQCKFIEYSYDYAYKLQLGTQCDRTELFMELTSAYLKRLYGYQAFESDVTYAYSISLNRNDGDNIDVTITIDGDNYTYTGSGDLLEIFSTLAQSIGSSSSYNFETEIQNGILYIYSYDTNLTFAASTSASITQLPTQYNTITATNLQTNYDIILDGKNCLTVHELCSVIKHSYDILEDCNC